MRAVGAFDAYLMVDWSSANSPKTGADSVWICWAEQGPDGLRNVRTSNPPTRASAFEALEAAVSAVTVRGMRALIGLDIPLGYPGGLDEVGAPFLSGESQWLSVWEALEARIDDALDNTNNRFAVANELNRLCGHRLFWGRPVGDRYDSFRLVPPRDVAVDGLAPNPLSRLRAAEAIAGAGIKSVWQLYGGITVGSQALTGIPYLSRLRRCYPGDVAVWPFETGFPLGPGSLSSSVTLAEMWPGSLEVVRSPGGVKDEDQVRAMAQACAAWQEAGMWSEVLRPASALAAGVARVAKEGWILGVG